MLLTAIVGNAERPLESFPCVEAGYRLRVGGASSRRCGNTPLTMRDRPVLFVDVDGVISLFGFVPGAAPAGRFETIDGIAHYLSATAGENLRRLDAAGFELVWCTGWEEKANEYLPHALGLSGPLPHLSFERNPGRAHAHWKLDAIEAYAGARPLAWIDDAHGEACEAWASARRAPTLLVTTEPAVGMTELEVAALLGWASSLAAAARTR
jgi:HAD domain in Swiss Army Knife RNA repair proteins